MLDCSKKSYPSQWVAERALHAIQESCRSHGRKSPTGSYSRACGTGVGSRGGKTHKIGEPVESLPGT